MNPDFSPEAARFVLRADPGALRLGSAPVPFTGARLNAAWSPGSLTLEAADIDLRPGPDAPGTRFRFSGGVKIGAETAANLTVDFDRLDIRDLSALWPAGLIADARDWTLENVTSGVAQNGHLALGVAAGPDLSQPRLTGATGSVSASELTVHWLRPIPPVEHGMANLVVLDPDRLRVDLAGADQAPEQPGRPGRLAVREGRVLITGLSGADQTGVIQVEVAGGVPDALALLANPRLHLLSDHPAPLKQPRGTMTAETNITVPLKKRVSMDEVAVAARVRVSALHLADVVAEQPLDDGAFDLTVTGDELSLNGSARLAAIPARITGTVDFRRGPPGQVLERFNVEGRADARDLAAAGLDGGDLLAGPVGLAATYAHRRDGTGTVDVRAVLDDAELRLTPLGWRKAKGDPASASGQILLDKSGRIETMEAIRADGVGLGLRGRATRQAGGLTLALDRAILGGTSARGTIRFLDGGRAIQARLSGPRLDLSGRFRGGDDRPAVAGETPAWLIDARFNTVELAHGRTGSDFVLRAEGSGERPRALQLSALTGPGRRAELAIAPDRGGRLVHATATDGGAVLRDLGALDSIEGGRLKLVGRFLDDRADHPLSGLLELDDFKVRGAPLLAKALQAITLYGLVQAVEGPGMTFLHMAAPFTYGNEVLTLDDARAFNASLGLTAKGSVDLAAERMDLHGTIVPAYFLNTIPGRLPLVGRLFSPEKGGGLFAGRYTAIGPLDDPRLTVNPLSALTPGFLRGVFGR